MNPIAFALYVIGIILFLLTSYFAFIEGYYLTSLLAFFIGLWCGYKIGTDEDVRNISKERKNG